MMNKTAVIIAAAGKSSRMGGPDKLFCEIGGMFILLHSVTAFENANSVDAIVIVTRSENIGRIKELCAERKFIKPVLVVEGGSTRAESVVNGINVLCGDFDYVAVHDGARPLVSPDLIENVVSEAKKSGMAIPAVKIKDTVKITGGGKVLGTSPRESLYAAQTPQVFRLPVYLDVLKRFVAGTENITDDSGLFEAAGFSVSVVDGDYRNIKITTAEDLIVAKAFWEDLNKKCTE